ncbi:NTP transferase domain-containing protein [Cerasicoccus fimbriatus]|uniref:NTP transferase domain-containing protein n=1 Tax=Cerasicoccus fimbriatus TaxID=3014554 RepID=UPI0022B55FD0|nr:NTP transferase domain-containing protein [Cerasicoccus sp. TK19100]
MSFVQENLYGLVLAGGRSRRLGRDKATLVFKGQLQLDRSIGVLKRYCEKVFISVREDQAYTVGADPIIDRMGEIGPLGGILSAFFYHRDKDWLVLGVDMPFINVFTVKELIAARDPDKLATCFRAADGQPEPLCSIYENKFKDKLLNAAKSGERSPKRILQEQADSVKLIDPKDPTHLECIITAEDYLAAQTRLLGGGR